MGFSIRRLQSLWLVCVLSLTSAAWAAGSPPPDLAAYSADSVEDAAISPGGDKIVVVGTLEGQRRLMFLDSSMKLLRALPLGDLKIREIEWFGEDGVLLTSSRTEPLGAEYTADKIEAYYTMIIPVAADRETRRVFGENRFIVEAVFGRDGIRQVGGSSKGYFEGIALGHSSAEGTFFTTTSPSLFEVDLAKDSARMIANAPPEHIWRDWLVTGDGSVAATFDMNRQTGQWTLANARKKTIASGTNASGGAGLTSLGQDGATVVYNAEDSGGWSHWYEVPLDGSAPAKEILAGTQAESIYVDKTNGRMIGYRRGGEQTARVYFDPRIQSLSDKIARAFKGRQTSLVDWTPDFGHVLVRTSGNNDSGTLFLVDLNQLKANAIGLERPAVSPAMVGPISTVTYTASDGLQMDGILTLPPGREAKGLPVVIFPHGGPSSQNDAEFDWWAQAFSSRGYAVFQPNFRGSTNQGDAFERAGDGEWGRKMQTDLSDGLAALAAKGIVDPKRACIMGGSYGGYAALAGVTLQHGIYRCAVAVAPVSDLVAMYNTDFNESGTSGVVQQSLVRQLGSRSRLSEVSPVRFAAKADAPILLVHGRDDTVVPFEQSSKMADALHSAGRPYEMVELKREDHWLSRPDTRQQMLEAAVAFVQKNNPAD